MTGWQPNVCECGHVEGDHKSKGPRAFHIGDDGRAGICLIAGCGCRAFAPSKKQASQTPDEEAA